MLGEKQVMEVLIVDKGTEQHRSVSSPPVVSLRWTETRAQRKGEVSNVVCMFTGFILKCCLSVSVSAGCVAFQQRGIKSIIIIINKY